MQKQIQKQSRKQKKLQKQQTFDFEKLHWKFRFSHGGILRNSRKGRGARPLSGKEPIHLVLKTNKDCIRGGLRTYRRYFLIQKIIDRYSRKFFIKIEQVSIQNDHIHFLIRCSRITQYQNFFRVISGQIAQQFQKQGLLNFALKPNTENLVIATGSTYGVGGATGTKKLSSVGRVTDTPKRVGIPKVTDTPKTAKFNATQLVKKCHQIKRLWKYRPFTRVIRGWKAYRTARSYVQLNEQEAIGNIPYRSQRLKGLSAGEWEILWG